MEYEILKLMDFKVPYPNHCFYLELLFSYFQVSKELELKIRAKLTQAISRLNFFSLSPKVVAILLISQICSTEKEWDLIMGKLSELLDFPANEIERMRIIETVLYL